MPLGPPVDPDEAVVYIAATGAPLADDEARLLPWLADEERGRAARFVQPRDRWTFVVAHALLQRRLCAVTGRGPWRLHRDPHGRPELADSFGAPPLRFSLSHTRGLAAVALAWGHDVGVDAEAVDERTPVHQLATRFFTAEEAERLARVGPPHDRMLFFRLWTAKEAVAKALGLGLSLPMNGFCIPAEGGAVRFGPGLQAHAGAWALGQRPVSGAEAAVAVRAQAGRPVPRITWVETAVADLAVER